MKAHLSRRGGNSPESGQTMTLVLLVLGVFLLAAVAFSVDLSNWWFHRQMARSAADAACTAGIMDMLVKTQGGNAGNFPAGSPPGAFSCSSNPGAAPCLYASLNGYSAPGLTASQPSNDVFLSFPASVAGSGLQTCSSTVPPPCIPTSIANPYLVVNVIDRTQTSFSGLLTGNRTTDVAGSAACALTQATAPVPIIVLNPTCQHAFEISGSTNVSIVGGPPRSIQVNSSNATCAAATTATQNGCSNNSACSANGLCINLSQAGPNFTGADFGVFGAPGAAPGPFSPGTTGRWTPSAAPISDPFAQTPKPTLPAAAPAPINIPYLDPVTNAPGYHGCPDHSGCTEYQPGLYTSPIVVKNKTAIFDPGIYYITGKQNDNSGSPGAGCTPRPTGQSHYGLDVDSNGVVRPADPASNASGQANGRGVMFYLSGTGAGQYGSVFFGSNAGNSGGRTVDPFPTANAVCPGGTAPPPQLNLPATVNGNVLLGQCTSGGTYLGGGSTDSAGTIRGLVFFQDRENGDTNGQASMQGGGGLVISGNMYFHHCHSQDGAGAGTNCAAPSSGYQAFFQLQGNPGGAAYVLGNVTTDQFVLSGNGNIAMALNPNAVYHILKATLIQ